jgi:hypothetical protein
MLLDYMKVRCIRFSYLLREPDNKVNELLNDNPINSIQHIV